MRVLGVDPGTSVTGWGVVEGGGASRPRRIASGVLRLSSRRSIGERLLEIHDLIREVVSAHRPQSVGLESGFVFRNVQSAFRLGEARGAILVAAAREGLAVTQYPPAKVKQAVVGFGRAEKGQIVRAIAMLLGIDDLRREDEADALAVALCHLNVSPIRERTSGPP